MSNSHQGDSPWHRLTWTLPSSLATGTLILWTLAWFTGKPVDRLPEPKPVDAQLIEIPPEAVPKVPKLVQKVPVQKVPVQKALPPVRTEPPVSVQAPVLVKDTTPVREEKPVPQNTLPPPSPPPAPAAPDTPVTGNSGAQALYRPMPQIPDELRQEALSAVALARFHVAADGTVTVELAKATQNPRLNRILLNTLKSWRFFPSMKDGKPVASTQEISIKVEVQ
jgi:protein TonB